MVHARNEVRDLAPLDDSLETLRGCVALAQPDDKLPPDLEDLDKDMTGIVEAQFQLLAAACSQTEEIDRDLETTRAMANKLLGQALADKGPAEHAGNNANAAPAAEKPDKQN